MAWDSSLRRPGVFCPWLFFVVLPSSLRYWCFRGVHPALCRILVPQGFMKLLHHLVLQRKQDGPGRTPAAKLPGGCCLISCSIWGEVAIIRHQVFISYRVYNKKTLLTSCCVLEKCGTQHTSYIYLTGNLVTRKRQLDYFCNLSVEDILEQISQHPCGFQHPPF